jgi:hypothetical protein
METSLVTLAAVVLGGALSIVTAGLTQRFSHDMWQRQTVRNEKKEPYFQILGILGRMRLSLDDVVRGGPTSQAAIAASNRLDDLREELYRAAPCAVMVLGVSASKAYEAFRRVAEPALQLNALTVERWMREREAVEDATNALIAASRAELRF